MKKEELKNAVDELIAICEMSDEDCDRIEKDLQQKRFNQEAD